MDLVQSVSYLTAQYATNLWPHVLEYLITLSPIVLMLILLELFWNSWLRYIRAKFFYGLKYVMLEIKLPKDTFKSPAAMESVFHSIHNTGDGSKYLQFWKGETRPWYSFELSSVEGTVKFHVWAEDRRKAGIMGALYSQYPGIEISEQEDYTRSVQFDPKQMKVWACEFEFTKDDPYPIKTYVDYGLDKDPKEEFKVDPLVPFLEWLGSVGPNQQVWFQIMVRAHKKEQREPGHLFKTTDPWHDKAEELVNKILLRDPKTKVAGQRDEETGFTKLPTISKGEQNIVEAIERSVSKLPFDVGIRAIYMAKKDFFQGPFGIGGIIGGMKHFTTEQLNGLKPNGKKWHVQLGDPWQDYKNFRSNMYARRALMAYRRRSYFYTPFKSKPLVMNTEELATLYHFPGSVAATPTLERVPSKKSEAPANLPV